MTQGLLPGIGTPDPAQFANQTIERALTLTQPWAGLITQGIKRIENRPWKLPEHMVGRRFAIHASREVHDSVVQSLTSHFQIPEDPLWRVCGAIIGTARLVGYVSSKAELDDLIAAGKVAPDQERFWLGPFAFLLAEARALSRPIEIKGALGFWGVSESILEQIYEQEVEN